ncbi:hypothetical protein P3594_24725, partial [Vibrio parahaemolyticus]|nr:hypothetical protein [Vibrio parahaemolyticus]
IIKIHLEFFLTGQRAKPLKREIIEQEKVSNESSAYSITVCTQRIVNRLYRLRAGRVYVGR